MQVASRDADHQSVSRVQIFARSELENCIHSFAFLSAYCDEINQSRVFCCNEFFCSGMTFGLTCPCDPLV